MAHACLEDITIYHIFFSTSVQSAAWVSDFGWLGFARCFSLKMRPLFTLIGPKKKTRPGRADEHRQSERVKRRCSKRHIRDCVFFLLSMHPIPILGALLLPLAGCASFLKILFIFDVCLFGRKLLPPPAAERTVACVVSFC